MIPILEELGIGFVPYSPLGKGFLMGKIDENANSTADFRSTLPRFTPEALKANQALIDLLGRIAKRKNATPAQIALAWLARANRGDGSGNAGVVRAAGRPEMRPLFLIRAGAKLRSHQFPVAFASVILSRPAEISGCA